MTHRSLAPSVTYFALRSDLLLSRRCRTDQRAGCVHDRLGRFENLLVEVEIVIDLLNRNKVITSANDKNRLATQPIDECNRHERKRIEWQRNACAATPVLDSMESSPTKLIAHVIKVARPYEDDQQRCVLDLSAGQP